MNKRNIDIDRYNLGFSLLKALMAFEVILAHFCNWNEYDPLIVWPFRELVSLAVSCFAIMSFYLMTDFFLKRDHSRFIKRMKRLAIPQIGWALLYFGIYLLLNVLFHANLPLKLIDLFWQILTGHSMDLNPTMWYQFNVIIITALFYLVFKKTDDQKGFYTLIVLLIFSYLMQYTGINRALFQDLPFELKKPLGRILEVIPFAVIGFALKYLNIFERLKRHRYLVMAVCVIAFLAGFSIPWPEVKGFDYSGFAKPYLSLCIVTFAYLVPLEKLQQKIKKVILRITDYTMGIYCCHRLMYTLLYVFFPRLPLHSFERCVLIYLLCYLFCFLIDRIPSKTTKQLID